MSASINLPALSVAGAGKSGIDYSGSGSAALAGAIVVINAVNQSAKGVHLGLATSPMRSNGGGVFQFNGLPNKVVEWYLVSGTGNLTQFTATTDDDGVAFCRYDAGGFTGTVTVGVRYGAV